MSDEGPRPAPAARDHERHHAHPKDQHDLPDNWCFGLAHPHMQRLMFLAGTLERSSVGREVANRFRSPPYPPNID
jgi:hypothetical protein